jgi:hypothetical protein
MSGANFLGRLLFFLPLVAAAVLLGPGASGQLGPAAFFALGLGYARFGAFVFGARGLVEAGFALSVLPFLVYAAAFASGQAALPLLVFLAESVALAALLLLLEDLLLPKRGGFALVLGFFAATAASGWLLSTQPAAALLAAAALLFLLALFASGRLRR